jgi:hypothetical protein
MSPTPGRSPPRRQPIGEHAADAGLAGLVNKAGIGVFGPLELIPIDQFRRRCRLEASRSTPPDLDRQVR